MKVGAHFYTAVTYRVCDVLKVINGKLLRYHINDLVAGRNIGFILVVDQLVYFALCNFFICIVLYNIASCL